MCTRGPATLEVPPVPSRAVPGPPIGLSTGASDTRTGVEVCRIPWASNYGFLLLRPTAGMDTSAAVLLAT